MKILIDGLSRRAGFDGWAIFEKGSKTPLPFTIHTTRGEARKCRRAMHPDLFKTTVVDKVTIEAVRA